MTSEGLLNARASVSLWLAFSFALLLSFSFSCPAYGLGGDILSPFDQLILKDPQSGQQTAKVMALDYAGNVVMAGYQKIGGYNQFYTIKVNTSVPSVLWTATLNRCATGGGVCSTNPDSDCPTNPGNCTATPTGDDTINAVAIDTNNDVIVVGSIWNGSNSDCQVVKYNGTNGAVLWKKTINVAGTTDVCTSVAVDTSNNSVYVGGYTYNGTHKEDFMIYKYDTNGTAQAGWNPLIFDSPRCVNNPAQVCATSLDCGGNACDNTNPGDGDLLSSLSITGNGVVVTGYSARGTCQNDISGATPCVIGSTCGGALGACNVYNYDYLTVLFNSSGVKQWVSRSALSGIANAHPLAVKKDTTTDNVVVTGYVTNANGNHDIYTVKYNGATSGGNVLGSWSYDGGYGDDPQAMAIDGSGDIYIAGSTYDAGGVQRSYVARYTGSSTTGAKPWEKEGLGSGYNDPSVTTGIALDSSGDVLVTGYSYRSLTSNYDWLTAKYNGTNGNLLWLKTFDTTRCTNSSSTLCKTNADCSTPLPAGFCTAPGRDDKAVGLAVHTNGDLYVAGWTDNGISGSPNNDYHLIKYDRGSLNNPSNLTATTLTNASIQLTWADNSTNETDFRIERKLGETGTYSEIATVTSVGGDITSNNRTVSFTDSNSLTANNYYYYQVRAHNASGYSDYSNEAYALTLVVSFTQPSWTYQYDNPSYWCDDNLTPCTSSSQCALVGTSHTCDFTIANDAATAIAVGPTDNDPVVTGYSFFATNPQQADDYYTVKLYRGDVSCISSQCSNDTSKSCTTSTVNKDCLPIWTDRYDGYGKDDEASCIAADSSNNVIVSGYSQLMQTHGTLDTNHIYTIKYNSSGPYDVKTGMWNRYYQSPSEISDEAAAVAVDASDNVVVAGHGTGPSGTTDIYLIEYLNQGTCSNPPYAACTTDGTEGCGYSNICNNIGWTATPYHEPGTGNNVASAVAFDPQGNVFVTGYVNVNSPSPNADDFFTAKYCGSANAPCGTCSVDGASCKVAGDCSGSQSCQNIKTPGSMIWRHVYPGPNGNDHATSLAVDSSGDVYVAGFYKMNAPRCSNPAYTAAGSAVCTAQSCCSKSSFVSDHTACDVNHGTWGLCVWITTNDMDWLTIKYRGKNGLGSSEDRVVWTKTYDGPAHGDEAELVAGKTPKVPTVKVDPIVDCATGAGIVVAGRSLTSSGNNDFHIIRYKASDGSVIWDQNLERPLNDDKLTAMTMDATGYIYAAGDTNTNSGDIISLIYSYDGTFLGAMSYTSGYEAHATDIAVNYRGEAFIAGSTKNAKSNLDFLVLKHKNNYAMMTPAPFTVTPNADYTKLDMTWHENTMYCSNDHTILCVDNTDCGTGNSCNYGTGFHIWRAPALSSTLCPSVCDEDAWGTAVNQPAENSHTVSWTDNTGPLNEEARYCYRIDANHGSFTSRKLVAGPVQTNLYAPTLNSPVVVSTGEIDFTWSDITDVQKYYFQYYFSGSWYDYANCNNKTPAQLCSNGTCSCNVTGLSCSINYSFHAKDLGPNGAPYGYSSWGNTQSAWTYPCAPSFYSPTPYTTSMYLSWGDVGGPASPNKNYYVQYKKSSDSLYTHATGCWPTTSAATNCTVSSLLPGVSYDFQVQAQIVVTGSTWAASTWTTGTYYTLPNTPTISTVTRDAGDNCDTPSTSAPSTSATIRWGAISEATDYFVRYSYCSQSASNPSLCAIGSGNWAGPYDVGQVLTSACSGGTCQVSYDLMALANSKGAGYAYYFIVYARVNNGNTWSGVNTGKAVWACMAPVSQATISAISSSSLQVDWTDINGNEDTYILRRDCAGTCVGDTCTPAVDYRTVPGSTGLGANPVSPNKPWTDGGLTQGASYAYKVHVYNHQNFGWDNPYPPDVESNERCRQTPPPAPDTVTLTNVSAGSITVNWCKSPSPSICANPSDSYTGYVIYRESKTDESPETDGSGSWSGYSTLATIGGNLLLDSSFENSPSNWMPMSVSPCTTNWTRRQQLTFSNFVANYQTKVLVTWTNGMNPNFDDIRFYDTTTSTEFPYWIEKIDTSGPTPVATVWVWVKSGTLSTDSIFMYYGNSSAGTGSNGTNTFVFFDDFNNFDTSKWAATGAYSVASSQLSVTTGAVYSKSAVASQPGLITEAKVMWNNFASYSGLEIANAQSTQGSNSGSNKLVYLITASGNSANVNSWAANGTSASYNINSGSNQFTATAGTSYILGSAVTSSQVILYKDRTATNAYSGTWSAPFYLYLGYFTGSASGTADISDIVVDWVLVRQYAATEPTVSFGAEQTGQTFSSPSGGCGGGIDGTVPETGANSLNLSSAGTLSQLGRYQTGIPVSAGTYILSGWFNTNLSGSGRARCEVFTGGTGGTGGTVLAGIEPTTGNTSGWVKLSTSYYFGSPTTVSVRCFAYNTPNGSAYVDFVTFFSDPSVTSYTDTTVTAGDGFKYQLTASYVDPNGNTQYTAPTVDTQSYTRTIPPTVGTLTLTAKAYNQIDVKWTDVRGDVGYQLFYMPRQGASCPGSCTPGQNGWPLTTTISPAENYSLNWPYPAYSVTGLYTGTAYCFAVRACRAYSCSDSNGYGGFSPVAQQMTTLATPSLSLTGATDTTVTLQWSLDSENAGYKIEKSTGSWGVIPSITLATQTTTSCPSGICTYVDSGLEPGTVYYYRISSLNNDSPQAWSATSNEPSIRTTPAKPKVSWKVVSSSENAVSWNVVYGATNYKIYRSVSDPGTYSLVADISKVCSNDSFRACATGSDCVSPGSCNTTLSYNELYCNQTYPYIGCPAVSPLTVTYHDTGLTAGTGYCYKVLAYDNTTPGRVSADNHVCSTSPPANLVAPSLVKPDGTTVIHASSCEAIEVDWRYEPCSGCETHIDGISIEAKTPHGTNGNWTEIKRITIPSGTTCSSGTTNPCGGFYIDKTGLNPGVTYTYRARVFKGSNWSPYSSDAGTQVSTSAYSSGCSAGCDPGNNNRCY